MISVLALIRPLDRVTQTRVDVRLCSAANANASGLGAFWEPAIVTRPRGQMQLIPIDLSGRTMTGSVTFTVALNQVRDLDARRLVWDGAPVTLFLGDDLNSVDPTVLFDGRARAPRISLASERLEITAEVSASDMDVPLLTASFDGSGGLGGDAGKRGMLKPAGFGAVQNIEPVFFDETRNIGMIDGYGNCLAITWLAEGLSSFGPRVADYPTYAALAAAIDAKTVKPGQWATCVAQGLIGLGAPPAGVITVHALFGFNRPGAMMTRILTTHAGIAVGRLDLNSFYRLDLAVPRATHYWTSEQRTVQELCEAIACSCNASPIVTLQNKIGVMRALGGTFRGTLNRTGFSDPAAVNWESADVVTPVWRMSARGGRPARVMSYDEVLYEDEIIDRGVYSPTETYRAGNLVWLADNSQYLYVNATPAAGHAPPVLQDAYWQRTRPPSTAGDFRYVDGTTLEALKPAEAGANVTSSHTAAGIFGQGMFATKDFAQWATDVIGAEKPESNATRGRNLVYNGDFELGNDNGGAPIGWKLFEYAGAWPLAWGIIPDAPRAGSQAFYVAKADTAHGAGFISRPWAAVPGDSIRFGGSWRAASSLPLRGAYVQMVFGTVIGPDGFISDISAFERGQAAADRGWSFAYLSAEGVVRVPPGARYAALLFDDWIDGPLGVRFDDMWAERVDPSQTGITWAEFGTASKYGRDVGAVQATAEHPYNVWDGALSSYQSSKGSAFVSGYLEAAGTIIGLTSDIGVGSADYSTNMEYRVHIATDGSCYIGTGRGSGGWIYLGATFAGASPRSYFSIVYEGTKTTWYANGVPFWSVSNQTPGQILYAAVALGGGNARVSALRFGQASDNAWASVGGIGRPADYADVTSANVSAGFAGQGAFATQSVLNLLNGSFFTYGGRFAPSVFGSDWFNAGNIAWAAGLTVEQLKPGEAGANVTEYRVAAAIFGQGAFATKDYAKLGAGTSNAGVLLTELGFSTNDAGLITALGVAAGFTGQGALATKSLVSAIDMLADAAVNRSAIVPGSLNSGSTVVQSGSTRLPITLNSPNGGSAILCTTGVPIGDASDAVFILWGATVTQGTNRGSISLQKSTDGVNWTFVTDIVSAVNGFNPGSGVGARQWDSRLLEDVNHAPGYLYLRVVMGQGAAQSLGDGTANSSSTDFVVTGAYINLRRFFVK